MEMRQSFQTGLGFELNYTLLTTLVDVVFAERAEIVFCFLF